MNLKGQKSLEMIIGLIMLLVVAAVVIGIFLNYFVESGELEKIRGGADKEVERQEFISYCQRLCSDYVNSGNEAQASAFCEYHQGVDLDGDRTVTKAEAYTKKLLVCEDNVYCFMVTDCQLPRGNNLDWEKCKDIECQVYMELYDGDPAQAFVAISNKIEPGNCALPADEDLNWWTRYGYDIPFCGG